MALVKVSQSSQEFETSFVVLLLMRYRTIVSSLLCAGFFLSSSQALTGDWLAVQAIPPGSCISVKIQGITVRCFFFNATDTELFCEEHRLTRSPSGGAVVHNFDLNRQSIRQIRLEHPIKSAFLGAVIGTVIGAGIGAALANGPKPDPEAQVYDPLYLGIISGIVGGKIMHHISIPHGKVVYRR